MPRRLLPLLLAPLLLAGCSSSSPDFTVPDDAGPEATIHAAGNATEPAEPYTLRIEVRHESTLGDGIPGAPVVFFDASQPAEVEAARTGPDGVAVGRFFVGGTISIAAGGGQYTVEEARQVVLGDPGEEDVLTLVLYDRVREVVMEGEMPGAVAVGLPGRPAYADVDLRLSDDQEVEAAYLARLDSVVATLEWSNAPAAYGDLAAGLRSADDSHEVEGADVRQGPTDSGNLETVAVSDQEARALGEAAANGGGLQARAFSRAPVVAPDGLPFKFTAVVMFEGSETTIA